MTLARAALPTLVPVAFVLVAFSSCAEHAPPPPVDKATLGGEIAARVGVDAIPVAIVAKVSAAQKVAPNEALKRLVDDAVCANSARARGFDRDRPTSWQLTALAARLTAEHMLADAKAAGPPTDAEIDELTKLYWREVDRPITLRVVHAVVLDPKPGTPPDPELEKRARALAAAIHDAVVHARDVDDFTAKAKAVPTGGLKIQVDNLPAIADDGFVAEGAPGQMDIDFTKGAFTLTTPGETSGIVKSNFGWHVIRLLEKLPEQKMSLEARRVAFVDEVYMKRSREATTARLSTLRAAAHVEVAPSAETLMRSLHTPADQRPPP